MNLYKICFCLLSYPILVLTGCSNTSNRDTFASNEIIKSATDSSSLKHRDGEILTYSTILKGANGYSLEIETMYIYDSLFLADNWVSDLNEVVISQTLIFKLNDSIIHRQSHDVKTRSVKKSIDNVSLLDNVIREAGLVQGLKGSFYKISGAGGCNACSEYLGYYSLDGKLLSKIYSSRMGNFAYSTGNIDEVIKQFEVSESSQKTGKLKVVLIYPPQYSGEIEQASLK